MESSLPSGVCKNLMAMLPPMIGHRSRALASGTVPIFAEMIT
jgi:hypothetical protein